MVVATLIANAGYSIIAPFMPIEFAKTDISPAFTGYIFAIYSIAGIVAGPFFGKLMQKVSRRLIIAVGLAGYGVSFIFFAAASGISSNSAFITYLIFARLLQGLASACV